MSDSCVTPWTVTHQVPLSVGSPRQEYWSGLPFPSPGDLPHPGIEATSPALAGGFFITEPSPVLNPPLPNPAHFKHLSPPSCPWLPTLPPLASRCLTVSLRVTPLQRPGRAPQDSQGIPAESFSPRGASVLRPECPAVFGDSSDPQRAARPQRKAYRKLKRPPSAGFGVDGSEPLPASRSTKSHGKQVQVEPSWAPSGLVSPVCLSRLAPQYSESAPSPSTVTRE